MKIIGDGINEVPIEDDRYEIQRSIFYNNDIYSIGRALYTLGNEKYTFLMKINPTGDFEWEKNTFSIMTL